MGLPNYRIDPLLTGRRTPACDIAYGFASLSPVRSSKPPARPAGGYFPASAEADVSNRTFYRYFTSKEDLVLGGVDDMAEALREALDARPVDEPVLASLAVVTVDLATLFIGDPDEVVARSRIIEANPILQQRNLERRPHLEESLLPFVADRLGLDPDDDPLPRLLVACVAAVSRTVIDRWIQRGSTEPLAPAVDEAFHLLEAGFGERLARVEVGAPR